MSADRRLQFGHYDQLRRAMKMEDSSSFFDYPRMEPLRVGPRIQKSDTNLRTALGQGLELARTPRAQRKRDKGALVDYHDA